VRECKEKIQQIKCTSLDEQIHLRFICLPLFVRPKQSCLSTSRLGLRRKKRERGVKKRRKFKDMIHKQKEKKRKVRRKKERRGKGK
jgi:hypothetical protein